MNHIWTRINAQQPQPEPETPNDFLDQLCTVEDSLHTFEVWCDDHGVPCPEWLSIALNGSRNEIMLAEAGTGTDGDQ